MAEARFARYRLLQRIGAGGMAEVFRAELVGAEGVARELVVKKIHHVLARDPEAVAMFVNEARLAARLRHPNVVQVYEFGKVNDTYFLAMELVEGCDLAAVIRAAGARQAVVPAGAAVYAIAEVLDGLGYVHALVDPQGRPLGLVHRDVSPHNVLLGAAGEVKLADFGIAKAGALVGQTAPHGVKGKFAYMPPEQARGRALDARADLFAAGAMLYELLAGRRPYIPRADGDLVDAVREGRIASIHDVAPALHAALRAVVARATDPDREARFADAWEFRTALLRAAEEAGVAPDRESLRALVRAVSADAGDGAETRADRTLTVHDEVAPTAEGDPPTAEGDPPTAAPGPEASPRVPDPPPAPATRPPARFLVPVRDLAAIVVGVAVLAALAGLRIRRGAPAAVAPVHTAGELAEFAAPRALHVALPDDPAFGGWLDDAVLRGVEARCGCAVTPVRYRSAGELASQLREGEADVAEVSSVVVPALVEADLVRRLDTLLGQVDARGYETLRQALRPGVLPTTAGTWFLPAAVDVVALAYRPTEVGAAVAGFAAVRPGLEARLQALTGHGLPVGFELRPSPAEWTTWDLLAAGWTWAQQRPPGAGGRVWIPEGPTREAFDVWAARTASAVDDEGRAGVAGAAETLEWDVLFRTLGLYHSSVGGEAGALAGARALADPEVAAAIVPASARGRGATGGELRLARLPRGDALDLDGGGDPVRAGARLATGEAWGWVAAEGSTHAGVAARGLLAVLGADAVGALGSMALGLPARSDVAAPADPGAAAEALAYDAEALAGGHCGVVGGPHALGELDGALHRPWSLWWRAVHGAAPAGGRIDRAALDRVTREGSP